jgi:Flp pilus assembly pilin Flp
MMKYLRRFWSDKGGTSAVEFAVIVPAFLIAVVGVIDFGYTVYQRGDLEAAMRSGAQYFMNGGKNIDTAVSIVDSAWSYRPDGAVVQSDRFCMCGTATSVCNKLCPDRSYPVSYHRIRASAVFSGLLSEMEYETSQAVRVR